jgi:hypothetical protein
MVTTRPALLRLQEQATAYHEAGHAVAAIHLGVGLGRKGISIISDDESWGFAHTLKGFRGKPDGETTPSMHRAAEKQTVVMFAGEAAQRGFRPRSVRRHHASADRAGAVDLMDYFVGSNEELEATLERLHVRAVHLVEEPIVWRKIGAVATALLELKRLTASEVKAICDGAMTVAR